MEFSTLKKKASDLRFSGERCSGCITFVLDTNAPFVRLYSPPTHTHTLEEPAHTENFLKSIKAHSSLSK